MTDLAPPRRGWGEFLHSDLAIRRHFPTGSVSLRLRSAPLWRWKSLGGGGAASVLEVRLPPLGRGYFAVWVWLIYRANVALGAVFTVNYGKIVFMVRIRAKNNVFGTIKTKFPFL